MLLSFSPTSPLPLLLSPTFFLRVGTRKFGNKPYLGTRAFLEGGKRGAYQWLTYSQCHERWTNIASGLVELGVKKVTGRRRDRLYIYVIRQTEWEFSQSIEQSGFSAMQHATVKALCPWPCTPLLAPMQ
jgi:hypothetical protein